MEKDLPVVAKKLSDHFADKPLDGDAALFVKSYLIKSLQENFDLDASTQIEQKISKLLTVRKMANEGGIIGGTHSQEYPKYLALEQIVNSEIKRYFVSFGYISS